MYTNAKAATLHLRKAKLGMLAKRPRCGRFDLSLPSEQDLGALHVRLHACAHLSLLGQNPD